MAVCTWRLCHTRSNKFNWTIIRTLPQGQIRKCFRKSDLIILFGNIKNTIFLFAVLRYVLFFILVISTYFGLKYTFIYRNDPIPSSKTSITYVKWVTSWCSNFTLKILVKLSLSTIYCWNVHISLNSIVNYMNIDKNVKHSCPIIWTYLVICKLQQDSRMNPRIAQERVSL